MGWGRWGKVEEVMCPPPTGVLAQRGGLGALGGDWERGWGGWERHWDCWHRLGVGFGEGLGALGLVERVWEGWGGSRRGTGSTGGNWVGTGNPQKGTGEHWERHLGNWRGTGNTGGTWEGPWCPWQGLGEGLGLRLVALGESPAVTGAGLSSPHPPGRGPRCAGPPQSTASPHRTPQTPSKGVPDTPSLL